MTQQDDSDHEDEKQLEFIERKDVTPPAEPQAQTETNPEKKESEQGSPKKPVKESPKQKNIGYEMQDVIKDQAQPTDVDVPASFYERSLEKKSYSIWSLDFLLRDYLHDYNVFFSYIAEIIAVAIILFLPSMYWAFKNWKDIDFKGLFKTPGPLEVGDMKSLFRFALFTLIWYTFDLTVMLFCDTMLGLMNWIVSTIQLDESQFVWSVVASIYAKRVYLRLTSTCFFIFYLTTIMFTEFVKPKSFELSNLNTYKVLVFWAGLYSLMHFTAMLVLDICIFDIKSSSYKKAIWDLNYKIFIFKKLDCIASASTKSEKEEIYEEMKPSFDPGLYLKYTDVFRSEEDSKIVANNIFVKLKKKSLKLKDIKKYFPEDYENVFAYFSGVEDAGEEIVITASSFKRTARDLYLKRKDMQKTLIDRDYVFDMLEYLISLIIFYFAAIVLCLLYDIDYNLYLLGLGSSLFTFSWIFSDSIKQLYMCFIFVLIVKPYDIGDRVMILDKDLKVNKIRLLHTELLTKYNTVMFLSNSFLFTAPIYNYSRSLLQCVEIEIKPDNSVTIDSAKKLEDNALAKIKDTPKHFINLEMSEKNDDSIRFIIYLKNNIDTNESYRKRKKILMKLFDKVLSEEGVTHKSSYKFFP